MAAVVVMEVLSHKLCVAGSTKLIYADCPWYEATVVEGVTAVTKSSSTGKAVTPSHSQTVTVWATVAAVMEVEHPFIRILSTRTPLVVVGTI